MSFDYTFGHELPELNKFIKTERFQLSEKIMDKRFEMGYTEEEMATFLNVSPDDYILMEFAEESIPVENYKKVIELLDKHESMKKELRTIFMDLKFEESSVLDNFQITKNRSSRIKEFNPMNDNLIKSFSNSQKHYHYFNLSIDDIQNHSNSFLEPVENLVPIKEEQIICM